MSTPRRAGTGYDSKITPIHRPKAATPLPSESTLRRRHKLRRWSVTVGDRTVSGWNEHPEQEAAAARQRLEADMAPGDTLGKLAEIVAHFGELEAATRIGTAVETLHSWRRQSKYPSAASKASIAREHYSATNGRAVGA